MTRTAREISVYGYYHVVQKGCGGQLIFEDVDDRLYLIRLIASKCQKFKVDVIAWCLMDNHIHLLLDDGHAHLSDCMHSITTAYAMYFNSKRAGKVLFSRIDLRACRFSMMISCSTAFVTFTITLRKPE